MNKKMKELDVLESAGIAGGVDMLGSVGLNDFLIVDSNPYIPKAIS